MVGCHLIFVEMISISPLLSSSSLLVFQLLSQFSIRRLFNPIAMIVVILSSFSSSVWASSYSLVPEALCCCSFGSILFFYQDHGVSLLYLVVGCGYCLFLSSYRIFCVPFSSRSAAKIFREFLLLSHITPHLVPTLKDRWFHSFVKKQLRFYLLFFLVLSLFNSWISGWDPLVV